MSSSKLLRISGTLFCTLSMALVSWAMISMVICRNRTTEPSSKFTTSGGSMAKYCAALPPSPPSPCAAGGTGTIAVILPSLPIMRSGMGCNLALMLPPAITAPKLRTKMPMPLMILPMSPPDFGGGGGGDLSSAASAIVRFLARSPAALSIEQFLCHHFAGVSSINNFN